MDQPLVTVYAPIVGASHHVVWVTINNIQAHSKCLHYRGASTTQIMERPITFLAIGKDQRGIVARESYVC